MVPNTTAVLLWSGVSLDECKVGLSNNYPSAPFPQCPQVTARMTDFYINTANSVMPSEWGFRITNPAAATDTLNDLVLNVTFSMHHELFNVSFFDLFSKIKQNWPCFHGLFGNILLPPAHRLS